MTLLICRTCPRYDTGASGEFGRRLIAAITKIVAKEPGEAVTMCGVQCLGGCPDDGVVAVDGPGKARVRFTGLSDVDAAALLDAAAAHAACVSGAPADWAVPAELVDRLSSVTVKRRPGIGDDRMSARPAGCASVPMSLSGGDSCGRPRPLLVGDGCTERQRTAPDGIEQR